MHIIKPSLTDHRLSRFIAWGGALVAWLALMLRPNTVPPRRRLKRYSFSLDALSRFAAHLIVLRASRLARLASRRKTTRPLHAPAGFTRRAATRGEMKRAAIGGRLRRRLRPRGREARIAALLDVFSNLETYAAALARRFRRRLTRLYALIPACPAPDAVRALATPTPCAADSS